MKKIERYNSVFTVLILVLAVLFNNTVAASTFQNDTIYNDLKNDSTAILNDTVKSSINHGDANTFTCFSVSDSVKKKTSFKDVTGLIYNSRPFRMSCVGIPLVVAGLAVKSGDDRIRGMRNEYSKEYNTIVDDYTQYLPGALLLGLKLGGVKSRSSWLRMAVSDAFSAALMAGMVNTMKHTISVERPDGSNDHSFPSGHTATAFMFATMLHKEYGAISPWYSIAGYSIATYTGVSRILNNKHWLSDVLVGAGIGILSAELGYFLADLIFKDKGINSFPKYKEFDYDHKPSFLGVYLGVNFDVSTLELEDNTTIDLKAGANAGLEGAYFFNRNFGLGGRVNVSGFPVTLNGVVENKLLHLSTIYAGPYFSVPLIPQILLGGRAMLGYADYSKCILSSLTLGGKGNLSFTGGVSLALLPSKSFNVRFFADYSLCGSYVKSIKDNSHFITIGAIAAMNF
ncbi:MAG: phosphatase PAP2 family protein [Muribaculaceae bacterium]|nr:phosphatase PAP2 family protein [Muribaculaceae bacterium]